MTLQQLKDWERIASSGKTIPLTPEKISSLREILTTVEQGVSSATTPEALYKALTTFPEGVSDTAAFEQARETFFDNSNSDRERKLALLSQLNIDQKQKLFELEGELYRVEVRKGEYEKAPLFDWGTREDPQEKNLVQWKNFLPVSRCLLDEAIAKLNEIQEIYIKTSDLYLKARPFSVWLVMNGGGWLVKLFSPLRYGKIYNALRVQGWREDLRYKSTNPSIHFGGGRDAVLTIRDSHRDIRNFGPYFSYEGKNIKDIVQKFKGREGIDKQDSEYEKAWKKAEKEVNSQHHPSRLTPTR